MADGRENITKYNEQRSSAEARENGKKGGIASGKSRRRKKCLQDTVKMLLSLPIKEGKLDPLTSLSTINGKNITVEEQLILRQIEKATKGDLRAFEAVIGLVAERNGAAPGTGAAEEKPVKNNDRSFIDALNDTAAEVWNEETTETDTV